MNVLVLGAGYAGVRAALELDHNLRGRDRVRVVLIDRYPYHYFVTQLHKAAAGTARPREVRLPLHRIFTNSLIRFFQGTIQGIDLARRRVSLAGGRRLPYDKLVVSLGSDPETFSIPGLAAHALFIQHPAPARRTREHLEAMFAVAGRLSKENDRRPYLSPVIGGGGLTGIELAGELAARLPAVARQHGIRKDEVRVTVVEALPDILPGFDPDLVEAAKQDLERLGVRLLPGTSITGVDEKAVHLRGQKPITTRSFIWAGGVRGAAVAAEAFPSQKRGRIEVDEFLRSADSPDVYVAGDCALAINRESDKPVAPTAQNAVAQGEVAARNILRAGRGESLLPYHAKNLGMLVSLGPASGIARVGSLHLSGRSASALKELNNLRYLYSLGGLSLLLRYWSETGTPLWAESVR